MDLLGLGPADWQAIELTLKLCLYTTLILLLLATPLAFATSPEQTFLDTLTAQTLLPRYATLNTQSRQLAASLQQLCQRQDGASLTAAREQWRQGYRSWMAVAPLNWGPSAELRSQRVIAFTQPYRWGASDVLVRKDSGIEKIDDLKGKTLATLKGSVQAKWFEERMPEVKTLRLNSAADALQSFRQGRADAYTHDAATLVVVTGNDDSLRLVQEPFQISDAAIGLRKGEDEWQTYLSTAVERMHEERLFRPWIEQYVPEAIRGYYLSVFEQPKPEPPPSPQPAVQPPLPAMPIPPGLRPPAPLTSDNPTQVPPEAEPSKEAAAPQPPSVQDFLLPEWDNERPPSARVTETEDGFIRPSSMALRQAPRLRPGRLCIPAFGRRSARRRAWSSRCAQCFVVGADHLVPRDDADQVGAPAPLDHHQRFDIAGGKLLQDRVERFVRPCGGEAAPHDIGNGDGARGLSVQQHRLQVRRGD